MTMSTQQVLQLLFCNSSFLTSFKSNWGYYYNVLKNGNTLDSEDGALAAITRWCSNNNYVTWDESTSTYQLVVEVTENNFDEVIEV